MTPAPPWRVGPRSTPAPPVSGAQGTVPAPVVWGIAGFALGVLVVGLLVFVLVWRRLAPVLAAAPPVGQGLEPRMGRRGSVDGLELSQRRRLSWSTHEDGLSIDPHASSVASTQPADSGMAGSLSQPPPSTGLTPEQLQQLQQLNMGRPALPPSLQHLANVPIDGCSTAGERSITNSAGTRSSQGVGSAATPYSGGSGNRRPSPVSQLHLQRSPLTDYKSSGSSSYHNRNPNHGFEPVESVSRRSSEQLLLTRTPSGSLKSGREGGRLSSSLRASKAPLPPTPRPDAPTHARNTKPQDVQDGSVTEDSPPVPDHVDPRVCLSVELEDEDDQDDGRTAVQNRMGIWKTAALVERIGPMVRVRYDIGGKDEWIDTTKEPYRIPLLSSGRVAVTTPVSLLKPTTPVITSAAAVCIVVVAWQEAAGQSIGIPPSPAARYRVLRMLGKGSYGVVYQVERKVDQQPFALKYITCLDSRARDMALRELRVLGSVPAHLNVVEVVDTYVRWAGVQQVEEGRQGDKDPGYVCLVMPFYPDGDLRDLCRREWGRKGSWHPPERRILDIARQICRGLHHLHACRPRVIHRDLKPDNVLVADGGKRLVLADFGLAREKHADLDYCRTHAGTLAYSAPEIFQRHYSIEVDIWAVGCIMHAIGLGWVLASIRPPRVLAMECQRSSFAKELQKELRSADYSTFFAGLVGKLIEPIPEERLSADGVLLELRKEEYIRERERHNAFQARPPPASPSAEPAPKGKEATAAFTTSRLATSFSALHVSPPIDAVSVGTSVVSVGGMSDGSGVKKAFNLPARLPGGTSTFGTPLTGEGGSPKSSMPKVQQQQDTVTQQTGDSLALSPGSVSSPQLLGALNNTWGRQSNFAGGAEGRSAAALGTAESKLQLPVSAGLRTVLPPAASARSPPRGYPPSSPGTAPEPVPDRRASFSPPVRRESIQSPLSSLSEGTPLSPVVLGMQLPPTASTLVGSPSRHHREKTGSSPASAQEPLTLQLPD
eukprot:Hpha_TRINITY_DN15462_c0_g12::TRINITY_DN15462_c0_g12_i1::g.175695::m.175695